ncbi:Hypothetical protein FKW44_010716 [Caligus rogercresseyi]|uniref:Uncharacterized protein n=1 Tax=Caligus rogercresseyi TaxID=217165 RepID=A0A7T8HHD6_CALRO|nr:Hypothetical protein FKW44_010716 [Caligus rogercresseyi]
MMLIAKSVPVPGGHQNRRVYRRGEEEGQRRRQQVLHQVAAEMGCSKQTIANTINKDLGYSSYKKRHRMILTEGTRRGCWRTPLPLEPGLVAPQLP